ncbi:hypothetical protein IW150_002873 [Coemansia sp. RSA 2607]|nr:hypothetical protein IW150_002873 [Coemansia sp. RSA 2607]
MSEYTLSSQAYAKAVLHAAKYPWAMVHGLFLGEKNGSKFRLTDAIPLAHNWTQLTPMFDVALQQVKQYASSKNLVVAGYYVAYENPNTTQLSAAGALFAKTILAINPEAAAFVVDAKRFMEREDGRPALVPFVYANEQWKEQPAAFRDAKGQFVLENNQVLTTARILVEERAEIGIFDFDDHLDDVSLDWLQNNVLNERIRTA